MLPTTPSQPVAHSLFRRAQEAPRRNCFVCPRAVTWVTSGIWKGPLWGAYFKKRFIIVTLKPCKWLQDLTLWWAAVIRGPKKGSVMWKGCWGERCCLLEVIRKHAAAQAPGKLAQSIQLRCRSCWVTKGRLSRCSEPPRASLLVGVNHRSIARRAALLTCSLLAISRCHSLPP